MPNFDTRQPRESSESNWLQALSTANRLRALLIGSGILLAVVAVGVGLLLYRTGATDALRQGLLHEAPNGKIAFVRYIPNDYGTPVGNVFVMNADGTGDRNLTQSTTAGENQPIWSPDGEKIAFIKQDENGYSINVMNADGTGRTRLTDDAMVFSQIAWSPDGERIAFSRSDGAGTGEIYVIDADGTDQTRLSSTAGDEIDVGAPVWSPDGEKIAFERYVAKVTASASAAAADSTAEPGASPVPEMSGIYVVEADGTGQATPINSMDASSPAWSPDGEKITFVNSGEIYTMNSDGTGQTRLTGSLAGDSGGPDWSPDERIAFVNSGEIYTMNADGTGQTRLTDVAGTRIANVEGATWSPDGKKIAFWAYSSSGSTTDLCAINSDGSGQTCLAKNVVPTNPVGSPEEVAWGTNTDSQEQGKKASSVESRVTKDDCRSVENSGGEIAFALSGDIWTMNADGSNATRLTHDLQRVDEDTPAWSPDGKKIAFAKKGMRTEVLAIMDSDGCNEVELPVPQVPGDEVPSVREPSWTYDGRRIAFMAYSQPSYMSGCDEHVFITNADGSGTPSIFPILGLSGCPSRTPLWSPDGSQIAFEGYGQDSWASIYLADISPDGTTGRPRQLPHGDLTYAEAPSWSPDGTEIAFGAAGEIYKIDVNSLEKTRLTSSPETEDAPTWSPDGEQIAFVREDSDTYSRAIYVMQSDGSNLNLARDFSQGIGEIEDHHTGTMRLDWRSTP
jgi:TolB protein